MPFLADIQFRKEELSIPFQVANELYKRMTKTQTLPKFICIFLP